MKLKIKLSQVTKFTASNREVFSRAWKEFAGGEELNEGTENFEKIVPLFNEWVIFDFKLPSGMNAVTEYYLKNPDRLAEDLLFELKQIIETQRFEMLEIVEIKRGEWIEAYGIFSGKTYKIYDHLGSLTLPEKGSFFGRVAKIDDKWLLVGSDTFSLPVTSTPRAKRMYLRQKIGLSPKDIWRFWITPPKPDRDLEFTMEMSAKDLKDKREKLKFQFEQEKKKANFKADFKKVLDFINNENYKDNFADFFKDLIKLGIPQEIIFKKTDLFNDLWNFFPHQSLRGKSPAEIYRNSYKNK